VDEKELLNYLSKPERLQLTREEYQYVGDHLGNINFLVFGTGEDSIYWRLKNKLGKILFLEYDDTFIDKTHTDIIKLNYTTKLEDADFLLEEYKNKNFKNLMLDLPNEVMKVKWDAIFVDSPTGYDSSCPGRMQSIFMASILSSETTDVFVHDINRKVENLYSSVMFKRTVNEFSRLRHVRLS
jgi:uncharacterized protein (TIGR01627 family)